MGNREILHVLALVNEKEVIYVDARGQHKNRTARNGDEMPHNML